MNFQKAATPVMEQIISFHNFLLVIIAAIAVFVVIMMAVIVYRFRESKNPTPANFSHNVWLEIVWTLLPVLILVVIAIPSWKLIFYLDKASDPEMTVKVTGKMWFWGYEYPESKISFDSSLIEDHNLLPGQLRLLSVDKELIVPVDTTIRIIFTASDVLHSWSVPAFGVKKDCVPGRLNESWIRVNKQGTYYGQCSELCGKRHGFMPIAVRVVSKEQFQQWVALNQPNKSGSEE